MNLIARIGVNPYWIAFNAHFWFAAFLTRQTDGDAYVLCAILVAAGFKEFWFDATQEVPKQTDFDNWTDFAGYALGAAFGCWMASYA